MLADKKLMSMESLKELGLGTEKWKIFLIIWSAWLPWQG